eukprot:SAG22_NODE_73_length_22318_cov_47.105315_14_plen_185_part_00
MASTPAPHRHGRRLRTLCAGMNASPGSLPGSAPVATAAAAAMTAAAPAAAAGGGGGGVTVALISHDGGPHVTAYMDGLAAAANVDRVVLGDIDGSWLGEAEARLGGKLAATYADPAELLAKEQPLMALVAMEAAVAPPVLRAALAAGCHILAEKPSCVDSADLAALVAAADEQGLYVMMALSSE